jgi:hypothetical protein
MERNVEIDGFDQPVGLAVILQTDGAVFFGAHDFSTLILGMLYAGVAQNGAECTFALQPSGHDEGLVCDRAPPQFMFGTFADQTAGTSTQQGIELAL